MNFRLSMAAIDWLQTVIQALIVAVISGTAVGALLNAWLTRRTEQIKAEVTGIRAWKEASLESVFGPIRLEFERTKIGLFRMKPYDFWLEANVVKASNTRVRDILLSNGHLIPPHLIDDATALIQHYDAYLQLYDKLRGTGSPPGGAQAQAQGFVFPGLQGNPFPSDAEKRMVAHYDRLLSELYGVKRLDQVPSG
jgi:hypothetical protein